MPAAEYVGPIDWYSVMPLVFKNTCINLNITLKSIQSGIPLRGMDIMGSGGFLLTNYQNDFLDFLYLTKTLSFMKTAKIFFQKYVIIYSMTQNADKSQQMALGK